jgi:hypothetical protein
LPERRRLIPQIREIPGAAPEDSLFRILSGLPPAGIDFINLYSYYTTFLAICQVVVSSRFELVAGCPQHASVQRYYRKLKTDMSILSFVVFRNASTTSASPPAASPASSTGIPRGHRKLKTPALAAAASEARLLSYIYLRRPIIGLATHTSPITRMKIFLFLGFVVL